LICGALTLLDHPSILRVIGAVGAVILFWFGWKSMTAHITTSSKALQPASIKQSVFAGYAIAFLSPFNILFWASMASQIAAISLHYPEAIYSIPTGLWLGVISWMTCFNTVLHITRNKISERTMRWFNIIGGLALWGFAVYGLIHVFS
ncbi:MAG: LysE family translocator, partial [Gammaproteobacteria bacterium]|nr:LysE family translocator [Gammaproteobacteria bacterium]